MTSGKSAYENTKTNVDALKADLDAVESRLKDAEKAKADLKAAKKNSEDLSALEEEKSEAIIALEAKSEEDEDKQRKIVNAEQQIKELETLEKQMKAVLEAHDEAAKVEVALRQNDRELTLQREDDADASSRESKWAAKQREMMQNMSALEAKFKRKEAVLKRELEEVNSRLSEDKKGKSEEELEAGRLKAKLARDKEEEIKMAKTIEEMHVLVQNRFIEIVKWAKEKNDNYCRQIVHIKQLQAKI